MPQRLGPHRERHRELSRGAGTQEPAALHHLRQRGRRQEHADRPAALRVQDALRRSARGARGRLEEVGTQGGELDFALLVDGLAAEREQGITIDVAYRFFSTDRRKFIVADTPGHEQYTRNMVTGASTADAAVILVDAPQGRADADAPAQLSGVAARHPPRRARRSTRWISWTTPQERSGDIEARVPRLREADRARRHHAASRSPRSRATTSLTPEREDAAGTRRRR